MTHTTHAAPGGRHVFVAHLRSAGTWSDPRMAATWILILPLFLLLFDDRGLMLTPMPLAIFATMLGIIFPAQLWWVMPSADSRSYFFAAPVGRATNALTRVLSGWMLCIAFCGAFLLSLVVIRHVLGHRIGGPESLARFSAAQSLPFWRWLVPLGGATLGYLYSSMAQIGSRRPQLWMLPVLLIGAGTPTFGLMLDRARVPIFGDILGSGSRFGLGRALMGRMGTVSEAGTDLFVADPSAWLIALTFWAGFGVLGLLVLAMTYREW